MAGSNSNIPTFYGEQFAMNVALKLQQKGSRLRGAVMEGGHKGSQASPVDQFGAISANKVTQRYAPITRTDPPTDRRWVTPADYDLAQMIDSFEMLRILTDPSSAQVENAVNALGRAMDQEILAGMLGTNLTGVQGATSTVLPTSTTTGQTVAVAQGAAAATNLTVAKLRQARKILRANEADESDEIFCAITAANEDSLLAEAQVISLDYNDKPVMVEGKVVRFLGINFIHTELLTTGTDDAAGTSTQVPVWLKSGVYCGLWNDITSDISQRKDLTGLPYQAYVYGTFGATRLEEKKVVNIWAR